MLQRVWRRVHCPLDAAEDAGQTVLERIWRNRDRPGPGGRTYRERTYEKGGELFIGCSGTAVRFTDYAVGAACRILSRGPAHPEPTVEDDELLGIAANDPPPEPDVERVAEHLLPCLTQLSFAQFVAVVQVLLETCPRLGNHLGGFLGPQALPWWRSRPSGTRGTDRHRGMPRFGRCLQDHGIDFDTFWGWLRRMFEE
jgi:hypothetical protein